jgi:hypothetical protein
MFPSFSPHITETTNTVQIVTAAGKSSSSRHTLSLWTPLEGDGNGISVRHFQFLCLGHNSCLHHVVAYFTEDSLDYLRCIEDFPNLAYLRVPPGKYKSARSAKGKLHSHANNLDIGSPDFSRQYVPSSPEREARVIVSPTHPSQPTPLCLTWINTPNDHNHHHHHRVCPRPITSSGVPDILAPLAYLQNIPPPTRHPLDEKALKLFTPGLV